MRDGASMPESDLDRLKDEVHSLAAEVATLRLERQADRAALRHAERQLLAKINEVATIHASRTWKLASMISAAATFRRRIAFARPAPAPAPPPPRETQAAAPSVPARDEMSLDLTVSQLSISLVVLPGGDAPLAEVLDRLRHVQAGRNYEVLAPARGIADGDLPGLRRYAVADAARPADIVNAGAAAAHGQRIVFWDPATQPHGGWLAALDDCLATFGQAGMAGAVLLAADGRFACADIAVAGDGTLQPLGRDESPRHPAFASVEPVDALPLGAIMVPREAWKRLGGLDPELTSLEHGFVELAQRARAARMPVLRQPFARLTRNGPPGNGLAGNGLAGGAAMWDDAYGRWRQRQLRLRDGNGLASLGAAPQSRPRVLFFDHFVPMPDRDSGSGDIYWYMRIFVGLGYEVTLLPVDDRARDDRYVNDLRRVGIRVVAGGWLADGDNYLTRERAPFDLIIVYRASLAAKEMLDLLQWHSPQAKLVFNTVDLHFLRMEREAVLTRSAARLEEAFRTQQVELAAITRADCTILLSQMERQLVTDLLPHARVCVIPIVRDIPGRRQGFAPRHGVVFVGGFQHRPNVDAIVSFVHEVWPLVRARLATTLSIIGADAPPDVQALTNAADGIELRGYVADLDAALASCRLTVAPLRYGAGIKGKIVSSIGAGVPCVASAVAVEGMGLSGQVRVATTPQEFADAIVELHETQDIWNALSDAGLQFARVSFSVAGARQRLCAMLDDLGLPAGIGNPVRGD